MLSQFSDKNTVNKQNNKLFSLSELIVLFFLFLAALNFLNRFAVCVFIAFAVFLAFCGNYIKVSNEIVLLLLFSLTLLIFWGQGHSSITAMLRTFTYPMCFLIGYNFPNKNTDLLSRERTFKTISVILALGTWLHLMLNFVINFENEEETRNTVDFWIGSELAATGQATLACLMIAVAVATLFSKNKVWVKILAAVALVLAFYYNLILAGRSMFFLLFVAAAVALIYFMKSGNKLNRTIIVLLCVAVVVVACVIIYNNNLFGIKDIIEESNFYNRFFNELSEEKTEDYRGSRKLEYLKYLIDYPFGGGHINSIVDGYAHDLYLDTYDEAGIFACLIIIIIVGSFAVKTFKVLRSKQISFGTKQMLLCLFVVLNLVFWMEPILAGMAWLLSCFCILYGNVCGLADSTEEPKRIDSI